MIINNKRIITFIHENEPYHGPKPTKKEELCFKNRCPDDHFNIITTLTFKKKRE